MSVDPAINVPRPCPVCNAAPADRVWSNYAHSGYVNIHSPKHKMMGATPVPLVCTQCGYVQNFVDPKDFRQEAS